MSALGLKQTCAVQKGMSALPPKADMCSAHDDVCFVPIADIDELIRTNRKTAWRRSLHGTIAYSSGQVTPNVESQSANKQCHHVTRRHKTIPTGEHAPKHPPRNGDNERPSVVPNPVHALSPTLGTGHLLYTGNQSVTRSPTVKRDVRS